MRLCIVILFIAIAVPGWGATATICSSGCDETSLAQYLLDTDCVTDGITEIEVQADSPGGTITLAERVVFESDDVGSAGTPLVVKCRSGDTCKITGTSGVDNFIYAGGKSYVTIDGFYVDDSNGYLNGASSDELIDMDKSNNIIIQNCSFDMSSGTSAGVGIRIIASQGCDASDNTIQNNTFLSDIPDENIIVQIYGQGSQTCGSDDGTADNLVVTGNTFNGGTWGLRFFGLEADLGANSSWRPTGHQFTSNTCTGIAGPCWASSAAGVNDPVISGNTISGSTGSITNDLQLGWVLNGEVYDNDITCGTSTSSDGSGIIIDWSWTSDSHICSGTKVYQNILRNCDAQTYSAGVNVYKSTNAEVYSNIITDCNKGIIVSCNESTGNVIYHNTIIDSIVDGIFAMDPDGVGAPETVARNNIINGAQYCFRTTNNSDWFDETYNLCYGATQYNGYHLTAERSLDGTDLTSDPDLSAIYRPNAGSPVISAGTSGTGVTIDYYGRSFATTPSIGAAEYGLRFNGVTFSGSCKIQ